MPKNTRTYQTRISTAPDSPLSAYAFLMAQVEHCLFADISKGKSSSELKSAYLTRFGITARQFNSVRIGLEGKIASIKTLHLQCIEQKKRTNQGARTKTPLHQR